MLWIFFARGGGGGGGEGGRAVGFAGRGAAMFSRRGLSN